MDLTADIFSSAGNAFLSKLVEAVAKDKVSENTVNEHYAFVEDDDGGVVGFSGFMNPVIVPNDATAIASGVIDDISGLPKGTKVEFFDSASQKVVGIAVLNNAPPGAETASAQKTVAEQLKQIESNPNGKALLDQVANTMPGKSLPSTIEEDYQSAESYQQSAVDNMVKNGEANATDDMKAAAKKNKSRADHARVSSEWHEWDYCVRKSKYWPLFKAPGSAGTGIKYVGVDKVQTVAQPALDGPPYWAWCRYPDLRKLFWVARRLNNELGRCGGKALWEALGHASKDDALKDALVNNAEWQALKTTLAADVNFATSP